MVNILDMARARHPGGKWLVVWRQELGWTKLLFTQIWFQELVEQGSGLAGRNSLLREKQVLGQVTLALYASVSSSEK